MIDGPFLFALTAGMVAAFNPCGFAMLPVYLAGFMGLDMDGGEVATRTSPIKAVAIGAVVSSGFVLVFGIAGLAFTGLSVSIQEFAPWITVAIGLALIPLGVALLVGKEPKLALPRMNRGTRGSGLDSMFLFGISYGVVSLSCTLPIFLAAVGSAFREESFVSGISIFLTYGLGMALVLMSITVGLAFARNGLIRRMKRILPYVHRISGGLLVLAGAYVAYYGFWELSIERGDPVAAGPVDFITTVSSRVNAWVNETGPTTLALLMTAVAVIALLVGLALRSRSGTDEMRGNT